MRDLQFWLEKHTEATRRVWELSSRAKYLQDYYKNWIKPFKLKRQYGHGLNQQYDGWKIPSRRRRWLKRRLKILIGAGTARREVTRIKATKIPFYEGKILALGGTVKTLW